MTAPRRLEYRPAIDPLEDRRMLSVGAFGDDAALVAPPLENDAPSEAPAFVNFVKTDVLGRYLFYNQSKYDANNPAIGAADDAAIAPDKQAYLPGVGLAGPHNVSSYWFGVNGVMVDIAGLTGTPTLDDFAFRTGVLNDPGSWGPAPAPADFELRSSAGVEGSDRVEIVWANGAVKNTWLEVTVKGNDDVGGFNLNTGLAASDVFYFGSRVGDTFVANPPTYFLTTGADQVAVRGNQGPEATISSPYDFDRNGLVNAADVITARTNVGFVRALDVAAAAAAPQPVEPQPDFLHWGDAGYFSTYAPTLIRAVDGTLLYFSEGRYGSNNDSTSYAVVMRRSFDDGATWTPLETIFSEPPGTIDVGVPTAVVDEQTGELFVMFTKDNDLVLLMSSADSGATWSTPADITAGIKVTDGNNPNPEAFPDDPWGWYAVGTGHGIQLQNGSHAGRLLIGALHRLTEGLGGDSWSHVIYSDDHGQTWHLGGGLDQTNPVNRFSNENTLVEGSDGSIYMSIRINNRPERGSSWSYDGGMTWSDMEHEFSLTTSPVHASLLRINENTVLFSAPHATDAGHLHDGTRQRMTIWISYDNMETWVRGNSVFFGYASYSDMVLVGPDTVLLVFNGGRESLDWVKHVYLARVNLRWLESAPDYQFTWHFNEKAPGSQVKPGGTSIYDSSLWDNRATPLGVPIQYVAGPDAAHTALRLSEGFDRVQLTPLRTKALQFESDESFTIEAILRTTDDAGIIAGTRDNGAGWQLKLTGGQVEFRLNDLTVTSSVTSAAVINDGQWHRITALRNAQTRVLELIIDGGTPSSAPDATTADLTSDDPALLGMANDLNQRLGFDIDVLRVTRRLLNSSEWLPAGFAEPPRAPALDFGSDAPNTIGGLQLWLPAYDRATYFADRNLADPLPTTPARGTAVHSAIDGSDNKFQATVAFDTRQVLYDNDPEVGSSWHYDAATSAGGHSWIVENSSGLHPVNFDFVHNTGVFTISTFVKLGASHGGAMTLFDNTSWNLSNSGFSLSVLDNGALNLLIVGENSTTRLLDTTAPGLLARDVWYHVAVVGHGAGQGVTYYATPVSASSVAAHASGSAISGPDIDAATVSNLVIGTRADYYYNALNGNMVDQAIYDRALSEPEIQMLFDYTKKE